MSISSPKSFTNYNGGIEFLTAAPRRSVFEIVVRRILPVETAMSTTERTL